MTQAKRDKNKNGHKINIQKRKKMLMNKKCRNVKDKKVKVELKIA